MSNINYHELIAILSRPRPSGSKAERATLLALQAWLSAHQIPFRLQAFTLYPYFFICIGLWMIFIYTLLAASIWLRWGVVSNLFVVLAILGGLVDTVFDIPLVTWPGKTIGQNLLIEFNVPAPQRELIISAHYDSKTELFDHHIRTFFVKNLRFGIVLAILSGIIAALDNGTAHFVSVLLTIPLLFLSWGLGLNLSMGRLRSQQSQGAVDNGAACAILLGLAKRISEGDLHFEKTKVTLALFGGEEVNMQGSRAYILGRAWKLPAAALNLEIMAQAGGYVYWEQDGTSLKLHPTNSALNQAVCASVMEVTGTPAQPAGPINSDGYSFIRANIPVTTLGTFDHQQQSRGLHLSSDNLERVSMDKLPEGVNILGNFITKFDLDLSYRDVVQK